MLKEKVKLALEALEKADAVIYSEYCGTDREELQICEPAIKALEEVLAQQEQGEPVTADEKLTRMKSELAYMRGQQEQGEPVAYRSRMKNRDGQVITGWVVHLDTAENPDPRVEIEPLYTTPQQSSTIVRKPLTDEELEEIVKRGAENKPFHHWFARAIEAAHGIKE